METYSVTIQETIFKDTKRLGIKGICAPSIDEAERILEILVTEFAYPTLEETPDSIKYYIDKKPFERSLKLVVGGKRFSLQIRKVTGELSL